MTFENQRLKLSGRLTDVQRPGRYLGSESNAIRPDPDADFRFCLLFPDIYDIGISYHGYTILYHILNGIEGVSCERSYLPWYDMQSLMRREGVALFSVESGRPLTDFDTIGITLQTELHYAGIVKALDLAGIPRRSSERSDNDPLIIGGGPCAFHPEPVALFFDAFLLGDGEEALPELVAMMRTAGFRNATRRERCLQLSQIAGVYVPELYTPDEGYPNRLTPVEAVANRVRAGVVTSLKPEYYPEKPIVPFVRGAHDRLTVEIMRGCTQGCRFCQAGMLHRPVRERPVADIVDQVMTGINNTGWDEIGLLSLSTSDYSHLEDLLASLTNQLSGRRVSMAFPSLRPATFTEEMARVDLGGRKSGVTFAVEAGSQRLRDAINKNLTEEELIEAVERAYRLGWKTVKLYFMVGLPTERMDDIEEGARLLQKLAGMTPRRKELHISVSPFIPKPHSVFGREEFLNTDELSNRIRRLYSRVPGRFVKTSWHDPEVSLIEALLARGDRRMSAVVESVATNSNGLDSWSEMMDLILWHEALLEHIPGWSNLLKAIPQEHELAWGHLSKGYSSRFYRDDLGKSRQARLLADCRSGECYNCGLTKLCEKVAKDAITPDSDRAGTEAMSEEPVSLVSDVPQRSETKHRYRLWFTKLLNVRYLGHQDLMTAVLRALRRAGTPLIYGQGYSHRPRVSYAPALPLGVGADRLWIEFETPVKLDADEWLQRWRSVFPSGIKPLTLDQVPMGYKSGTAQLQKRAYRLRFNRRVKISSDTAVRSLCSDLDIDRWNLHRKGRTLTLQLDRQSGETLNPVETGLKMVVAEPGTVSNSIRVLSLTQLTETRFASKSLYTAESR